MKSIIKAVTIPRFRETGKIVLMDLKTLETFDVTMLGHDSFKKEACAAADEVIMIDSSSMASPIID